MTEKVQVFNPRIYMELAIVEMNKSKNEPRKDGKVPPKVGAVLVFPDGKVELAHRGELRDGDHAEFTLLERKFGHKKLDECILFTTLEPCVERNSPKIACCRRTAKTRIKTVYVGIEDPDHTVEGKGIKYLEDRGVKIIMFDRELQTIIEEENAEFIKQAKERKIKKEKEDLLTPLEKTVPSVDVSQFSDEAQQKFIQEAKLPYTLGEPDFHLYLADIGVIEFDEKKEVYRPNGFGILLFGKNPRARYKQAALMASVDYGNGKTEPATFDQPLVLIPDLVEKWLKKTLPLSKDTSSFKRIDVPDFPIEVLREAIINAIVHRDYIEAGSKSALEIDNDKIVIKSPGAPLPSISLGQLNSFNAPSISRNPLLTYVFGLMDYVEEKGFGMKSLKSLNEKYNLPLPTYTFEEPFLSLTFPRNVQAIRRAPLVLGKEGLNDEELSGYDWIRLTGEVSARWYATHFNYGYKKAQRHLAKMKELNLITDNGEPTTSRNYKYHVVNEELLGR